ncbi:hypothetical protein EE612_054020 [Oryza sativa]|nr:hypothetical protein EE612_054020 [Oryza sativa]
MDFTTMATLSCSATPGRLGNRSVITERDSRHGWSSGTGTAAARPRVQWPSSTSAARGTMGEVRAWSTNIDTTAMVILATSMTTTMPPASSSPAAPPPLELDMIFLPSRSASLTAALTSDSLWRMASASSPPGSSSSHQPPPPPPFSAAAAAPAQPTCAAKSTTMQ